MIIRAATWWDVAALAREMRAEDVAEVRAVGHRPEDALRESLLATMVRGGCARVLAVRDHVLAMWGARPADGEVLRLWGETTPDAPAAVVWMLSGREVEGHWLRFARASRLEVQRLLEVWPSMVNWIDSRYLRALRWARWTGGELLEGVSYAAGGVPFVPVIWRAHGG